MQMYWSFQIQIILKQVYFLCIHISLPNTENLLPHEKIVTVLHLRYQKWPLSFKTNKQIKKQNKHKAKPSILNLKI